jgi:ATP-binding cassette subfamily B protein
MQQLVDRLNLVSREILTGIPVIRAFSREAHEEARFDEANRSLMKTQLFTGRVMSLMMPMMMLIMNGVTVAILWFGAKGVDLGTLQVGDMIAFITYTMQIIMAFMMMTMMSIMLPRASVAAGRID